MYFVFILIIFSSPVLIGGFHLRISDSKSSQFSNTFLSILADFINPFIQKDTKVA